MNAITTALLLLLVACLEVGGDAIIRAGLKQHSGLPQWLIIAAGGLVLLAYGVFVNIAPTDFGRALGMYVVLFYIIAQLANLLVFGVRPDAPILAGGALILAGGLVMAWWKPT